MSSSNAPRLTVLRSTVSLAVGVDAMHTEAVLGQIDTDGGDLSHDGLLCTDVPDWYANLRTTRGGAGCGSPYHSLGRTGPSLYSIHAGDGTDQPIPPPHTCFSRYWPDPTTRQN
jgi:hypothetical protein